MKRSFDSGNGGAYSGRNKAGPEGNLPHLLAIGEEMTMMTIMTFV
jgi:hypothetical protein